MAQTASFYLDTTLPVRALSFKLLCSMQRIGFLGHLLMTKTARKCVFVPGCRSAFGGVKISDLSLPNPRGDGKKMFRQETLHQALQINLKNLHTN